MLGTQSQQFVSDVLGMTQGPDTGLKEALEHYKRLYMASRNLAQRTRVEYENDLRVELAKSVHSIGRHRKVTSAV